MHKDSDALWRIYSSDKKGIRIKTSIVKIYLMLERESEICCVEGARSCNYSDKYLGKVVYGSESTIFKKVQDLIDMNTNKEDIWPFILQSLFLKRQEFDHEKEIRITYLAGSTDERLIKGKNLIAFDINPYDFIEEIAFDPRIEDSVFNVLKAGILQKYKGLSDSKIVKSDLNQLNQHVFEY